MFINIQRIALVSIFILTFIFISTAQPLYAEEASSTFQIEGVKSAFLFDASSGEVLYEYNANTPRPPASMTKMMTYFVVRDAIEEGKVSWDEMVTASEYAAWTIGSQIGLEKGEAMPVRDLLQALLIISANDAAVMLAEHIAGSEIAFAQMMNEKARSLGLSDGANFVTASGLGRNSLGPYDPKHIIGETVISARDTAMLAYHLINTYPEVLNITSTPAWGRTPEQRALNTNLMLTSSLYKSEDGTNPFEYPGLDGLKTGFIYAAGNTFTGTAVRNGTRLISVVMGAETSQERFSKTKELLDYGFAQYDQLKLIKAGQQIEALPTVSIIGGDKQEIPVIAKQDVTFLEHPSYAPAKYSVVIDRQATLPLNAPITKGDRVGVATILYRGSIQQVDLIAAEDVMDHNTSTVFLNTAKNFALQWLDRLSQWYHAFTNRHFYTFK